MKRERPTNGAFPFGDEARHLLLVKVECEENCNQKVADSNRRRVLRQPAVERVHTYARSDGRAVASRKKISPVRNARLSLNLTAMLVSPDSTYRNGQHNLLPCVLLYLTRSNALERSGGAADMLAVPPYANFLSE